MSENNMVYDREETLPDTIVELDEKNDNLKIMIRHHEELARNAAIADKPAIYLHLERLRELQCDLDITKEALVKSLERTYIPRYDQSLIDKKFW